MRELMVVVMGCYAFFEWRHLDVKIMNFQFFKLKINRYIREMFLMPILTH
jgi:hypothetical protein